MLYDKTIHNWYFFFFTLLTELFYKIEYYDINNNV